jgi:hypothetical protein
MNYVESTLLRTRGSHAKVLSAVAFVIFFDLATMQSAPWLNGFIEEANHPLIASAAANSPLSSLNTRNYNALPIILTVPFAVTRTQQMMLMRLKQRQIATHIAKLPGIKGATGLIAGLALIQAVQSSSSH